MNLVCIKHSKYDGKSSPVLSCKTCCSIFIGAIKERNATAEATGTVAEQDKSIDRWLDEKSRDAAAAKAPKRLSSRPPV